MTINRINAARNLVSLAVTGLAIFAAAEAKPLKVYILAGQSNMEGQAKIETFDYIGDDPATAPLLKAMRGPDGEPRVCDKVWISYLTGAKEDNGEGFGSCVSPDSLSPPLLRSSPHAPPVRCHTRRTKGSLYISGGKFGALRWPRTVSREEGAGGWSNNPL